ncbi:MAG: PAS domain S-box protein [Calothrix sp. C42_A2020_038]|nr:PAS domain S-box protein [Calothrix sp. C42_A2020_038]
MTLEQRFFNLSPDLHCVIGMNGLIQHVNPAFEKILGFSLEEVLGKSYLEFVHVEQAPATVKSLSTIKQGITARYHNFYRCKDGSYKWIEWIVKPVLEEQAMYVVGRDFTEQKQILEERERFFSVGADLLCIGSFDGYFTWLSPSWEKTFGWTTEELKAYPWLHFVHPEDYEKTLNAGQQLLAGIDLVSFENRYRCKDGSYRWISWRSRPFSSEKLIYGAAIDITERKLALSAAEEKSLLLKAITDNASVALFIMDEHQHCVFMNPAAEELTGFTLEEVQGKPLHNIIHHTRPDGTHYPLEECPIDRAFPEHNKQQGEEAFIHKDGHFYTVFYTASPLHSAGKIRGTIIEVQDISIRKAAEQALQASEKALEQERVRLRAVLDNIPVAVVLAEAPNGKIVMANKRTEEIFRHPVFYSNDIDSYYEWESYDANGRRTQSHEYPLAKVFASGEPYQNEYHYQRGDGTRTWVRIMGAPIKDHDGKLIAAVVAVTDIDAEKQQQERREQLLLSERSARAEAERVGRMKDEFLATLSHELRTPLNAILGWSQIIRKGKADAARIQQGLDTIERNVRVQSQLIEDLLDMSRIISGKIRLDIQRVDIKSVIEAALETVRFSAEAKGVQLETVFDQFVGVVAGDGARLQQVIWNLLSNAIKFTPKNGKVQVILKRVDSRLEVSVTDTGLGINPEFLPYVFERFSQADGSITRKHGGLGLGLSIVRGLTELHGGSVTAKSDGEGMGATFTISLPIAAVIPSQVKQNKVKYSSTCTRNENDFEQILLPGVKILVVDDEADARELIRYVLEEAAADVITAGSAQDGFELIKQEAPDILISDIGMPGEDGYEFIRKVRSLSSEAGGKIPAVALTAYARVEDRKRALLAGYQMHITKPVEPSELIALVSSLRNIINK